MSAAARHLRTCCTGVVISSASRGAAREMLDDPERGACLALRYRVAEKIHAVTEQPDADLPLDVDSAADQVGAPRA